MDPLQKLLPELLSRRGQCISNPDRIYSLFSVLKFSTSLCPGYNVQHYIYIDNIYWKIYIKNIKIVVLGKLPERKIYRDSLSNRLSASTPIVHKKTNLIRLDDAIYKGIVFKYDM